MDFRVLKIENGQYILQYKSWWKWHTVKIHMKFKESNRYFSNISTSVTMLFSSIDEAKQFAYSMRCKKIDEGLLVNEFTIES